MNATDALLLIIGFLAWSGLFMYLVVRITARRTAQKMWQEALDDKSGRKMRAIEKWLKDGPPPG